MSAPTPIIPPDPLVANVDWRYDGCFQSMNLVTLTRILDAVKANDPTELAAILAELVTLNGKVATEVTLADIKGITDQMNFTGGALDVNATISTAGLSTEAKQDTQITLETAANVLLTSLDGKDFATQATLEAVRVLILSLDGKDFSTETTLALAKTVLDNIKLDTTNLDVALSTRATEATLELTRLLLFSIDAKDFATETTLASIKAQTDQMVFTANKLRTTGEDGSGGGGFSSFGDSGGYANLAPDGTNQLVLAADTDFKEVILYHENKKQGWIKFGGGAAVVGEGFPIKKKQPWILDRCRDEIRIIFESGFDAKDLQINTVKL